MSVCNRRRPGHISRRASSLALAHCWFSLLCACCCCCSYPIEDTHEGEPSAYFADSCEVITKIKEDRSLIFVHGTEGKTIAPTIVLNYMMQSAKKQNKHLTLLAAYNFLGAKAPGINVPDQFMAQLLGQCARMHACMDRCSFSRVRCNQRVRIVHLLTCTCAYVVADWLACRGGGRGESTRHKVAQVAHRSRRVQNEPE